jgi:hypothetical protein
MNKTKAICLIALAALLAAPGLWAQASNTSDATASIFSTDVDSYMDVNDFGDVAPDAFFSWLRPSTWGFEAGYARYLGGGYLGLYGGGSFLNGGFSKTVTENNAGSLETPAPADNGMSWNSQVDILYGTESLGGFKLSLYTSGSNNDTDLTETSSNDSTETKNRNFRVSPWLDWGKNFSAGPGVFKFAVGLGTSFYINNTTYTTVASGATTREETYHYGYTTIGLNPRVTWVMNPRGNAQSELYAGYSLSFRIYPDLYRENPKATTGVKEQEWDRSYTSHNLAASFKTTYTTTDTFSWGWLAGLSFNISTYDEGKTKTTLGNGTSSTGTDTYESTDFGFSPWGNLGISYKLKPGVLTLNGGITVYLPFGLDTSGSEDTTGTVTTETSSISFSSVQAWVSAGIAWQLTPELGLDSRLSYGTTSKEVGINAISILATYKR